MGDCALVNSIVRGITGVFIVVGLVACGQTSDEASALSISAQAYAANAERWVDSEFQPSTLTRDEQLAELAWFNTAAEPVSGYEHQCGLRDTDDPSVRK